ncbi:hypothetical protein GCM10022630_19380 [Thermobifida alba]
MPETAHPLLAAPLRYRWMLLGARANAVIRRTCSGWEVVQSHAVRDGDEVVCTYTDLLDAGRACSRWSWLVESP